MAGEQADVDYCRVSMDRAHGGEGEGSQHEENVELAQDFDREITASYVDNDVSAYSGVQRPEYERLCRDIERGAIASVTFWHANRLHRDIEQASQFLRLVRTHGVRLFSVAKGGEYNLNRSAGRQDFLSDTLKSQGESDERGDRIALARKRQARNGDFGGGVRPYGWGVDTGRVRSVCTNPKAPAMERVYEERPVLHMSQHNPTEAAEIRSWADDILAGVPLAQVLRDLAKRQVPTVSQTDGRSLRRNGKQSRHGGWNSATLRQILTSPRTSGHRVHHGRIVRRYAYEPIIDEDKRQALITLFSNPARKNTPGNTPKWLGSLIYRCGVCDDGARVSVRNNSRGTPCYRCHARNHSQHPVTMVDEHVQEIVVARLSRADAADLIPGAREVDVGALREELRILDERKVDAAQRFAAGSIDGTQLETITATLEQRMGAIRAELADSAAQSPLAEFAYTTDARRLWRSLPLGRKREILKLLPITITLLPIGRGGRFSSDRIRIDRVDPTATDAGAG
ncbi:recombinase family protein [Nocardiopsis salina]|uniref:recombinase family protein n=1 Tax=Nocardiopsis salina TaxID=245836 RepID=UPI0012695D62|nr:recombinase family protein [Nocardiopsis salina]